MKSVLKLKGKNMDEHSFNKLLEVCSWEEGLDDKYLAILPINQVSTAYDDIKNILLSKDFLNDVKNNKCKIIELNLIIFTSFSISSLIIYLIFFLDIFITLQLPELI